MKKIKVLLAAVAMLATTGVMAQSSPWWLEGGLGFSSQSGQYSNGEDKPKTNDLQINVGLNYQLNPSWSVGATLGYNHSYTEASGLAAFSYEDYKSNLFGINVHADYGVRLSSRWSWAPRIYAELNFGSGKYELFGGNDYETDIFAYSLGIRTVAFNFRVNKNLVVNMGLDLGDLYFKSVKESNDDWKDDATTNTTGFQFGTYSRDLGNIGLTFGLHYHF